MGCITPRFLCQAACCCVVAVLHSRSTVMETAQPSCWEPIFYRCGAVYVVSCQGQAPPGGGNGQQMLLAQIRQVILSTHTGQNGS
jgi:hypothetical protein